MNELINEGKFEEALQHIKDLEYKNNLNSEETFRTQIYKGMIYNYIGQREKTLKIAEHLYQKSQEIKMPLFSLSALALKLYAGLSSEEDNEVLEQYESIFKSIPREDSLEFQKEEAWMFATKGMRSFIKGDFDLALDYFHKSLMLFEQVNPHSLDIPGFFMTMAYCYLSKGELQLALEHAEKALLLIPKGEYHGLMVRKADIYRCMGNIYNQKGDLNKALEYFTTSLEIYEKVKEVQQPRFMGWIYYNIIDIFLSKSNLNQAQNFLQQFNQLNENNENWWDFAIYQLSHALILKSSSRIRDHAEAESILKKIIEENATHFVTNFALINLCDWYFEEFQISHQMEILDDINPHVDHLQKNARDQNSYWLLAHVKLLQAKLALIQINMLDARKLLTEAQQIADEHGLQLLAGEISKEHDHFLEELKLWETIKKTQVSVAERLKLASLDDVLERMQGRRAIEVPELSIEEPILLLIMDKSGVTYFNHSFIGDWDFDDLFSAFMSAFNSFSSEIFSKSIDRIKIGENTILINPIEPFLACYIIKGQSYPAQQKLTRFSEFIQTTTEIWDALNKAVNTSEMLELNKPPSLGSMVNEIFM